MIKKSDRARTQETCRLGRFFYGGGTVSVKKQRSALRAQGLVQTLRSAGYPDDR